MSLGPVQLHGGMMNVREPSVALAFVHRRTAGGRWGAFLLAALVLAPAAGGAMGAVVVDAASTMGAESHEGSALSGSAIAPGDDGDGAGSEERAREVHEGGSLREHASDADRKDDSRGVKRYDAKSHAGNRDDKGEGGDGSGGNKNNKDDRRDEGAKDGAMRPGADEGARAAALTWAWAVDPVQACVGIIDTGLQVLPGSVTEASTFAFTRKRTVDTDNKTVLLAIAVGRAVGRPVDFDEVSSYTEERSQVCTYSLTATLPGQDAILALALGARRGTFTNLERLAGDTRFAVIIEYETRQSVRLDEDVVFAALALHGAGGRVAFEDIVSIDRSTRVIQTVERIFETKEENVLSALALRG